MKVVSALADAILFLHQNHICFRDLKPVSEEDINV
jgi:serine/threonine protein kinase